MIQSQLKLNHQTYNVIWSADKEENEAVHEMAGRLAKRERNGEESGCNGQHDIADGGGSEGKEDNEDKQKVWNCAEKGLEGLDDAVQPSKGARQVLALIVNADTPIGQISTRELACMEQRQKSENGYASRATMNQLVEHGCNGKCGHEKKIQAQK